MSQAAQRLLALAVGRVIAISPPKLVDELYDMPGGGMERMGTGQITSQVVAVLDYR